MIKTWMRLVGLVALCATLRSGGAEETSVKFTPLQLSFFNPLQVFPEGWDVYGLRLNGLFGLNRDVYGIDIGFKNASTRNFGGVQLGVFNVTGPEEDLGLPTQEQARKSRGGGLRVAAIASMGCGDFKGVSIAGILNQHICGTLHGFQMGGFNTEADNLCGMQLGINNAIEENGYGVQLALLCNRAKHMKGLQIGLINVADTMDGIQFGAVNVIKDNPVPFLPFINAHF